MESIVKQAQALKISLDAGEINIHAVRSLLNKVLEGAPKKTSKQAQEDALILKYRKKYGHARSNNVSY
jgi:hypothetical protein